MIHIVFVTQTQIGPLGQVIKKTEATIKEMLRTSLEMRIVPDESIPNSAGSPTIKGYLEDEDGDGYALKSLTNTMIVTQTI